MEWLTQNWIWLALGFGAFFMMRRHGFSHYAGGHAGHGRAGSGRTGEDGVSPVQAASDSGHGEPPERSATANGPEAAIDPVNGEPVRTDKALTTVYQGSIYYFAFKENRDRFEAAPQEYAQKATGHPVGPAEAANEPPRRRHGC